jgi:predicted nucleic acid-binding protein
MAWELENALRSAERRGRISERGVADALRRVAALPIAIDPVNPSIDHGYELHLSRRFALTVYDAAYLDLAQRRGLLPATKDQALRESAETLGVLWTAATQSG